MNELTILEKRATKNAYHWLTYHHNIRFRKPLKVDRRTTYSKILLRKISEIQPKINLVEVEQKQKLRKLNKPLVFNNYLLNPIVKDYLNNRNMIQFVNENHLHFYDGRNHWAKNQIDIRILAIIKKHFKR